MRIDLGIVAAALAMVTASSGSWAATDDSTLPGYALGQPLDEARRVVPPGQGRDSWALRCTGDSDAPPGLAARLDDQPAGTIVCWPLRRSATGWARAATLPKRLGAEEEIAFLHGRVTRITQYWRRDDGSQTSITYHDAEQSGR